MFENGLNVLSQEIKEDDIFEICKIFDDNTKDDEVMFRLIHLMELFSSEKAFELTVLGLSNMLTTALNWAKIIIYRCLNDDFSKSMLKETIKNVEPKAQQKVVSLLNLISSEDFERFGTAINYVLN